MASLRKESDRGRVGWRLQFRQGRKRRSLWLGGISKRAADTILRHVDELARCHELAGVLPDRAATEWVASLKGRLRERLADYGLCEPEKSREVTEADLLLGPYCDRFIKRMVDVSPRTKNNYKQTRSWLCAKFGEEKPLAEITVEDMNRWLRHMKANGLALSNRNKHIQRGKKMFASAVDDRLIAESPAAKLKQERPPKGKRVDRSKQQFVDATLTKEVLDGLPAGDIRLTFAMARFMGLRRCEVYRLTWSDVDWERDRMRIDSIKTGERECPLFEALPYLREAFDDAPDGATRIITHFANEDSMTTLMRKYITGVVGESKMWPKTLQQLRSTRRTELEEEFPNHVVNEWLGHDGKTAEAHYLQVTPDHWDRAKSGGGVTGGVIVAENESFAVQEETPDASDSTVEHSKTLAKTASIPPSGVEPLFPD